MNCGNELSTFGAVNYCPKCGHPIRMENKITKHTGEGRSIPQGQEGISPRAAGENRGKVGDVKAEEKKEEMSLGFAIFVVAIIIFFVAVFARWIWERYVTDQMFDKGCSAMGYNMWGFVDEWDCP